MTITNWTADEARLVTVEAIRRYLLNRGWVQKPSHRSASNYYEHPDMVADNGNPIGVYASKTDRLIDYPLRVLDFISVMCQLYHLRPPEVYAELTAPVPAAAAS